MTTTWCKMESWKPVFFAGDPKNYRVIQKPFFRAECLLRNRHSAPRVFSSRAAALRAANAANRLYGLPEVT